MGQTAQVSPEGTTMPPAKLVETVIIERKRWYDERLTLGLSG